MDITPIYLDYITAPLEDIVKGEIYRLESSLTDLKEEGRLCGEEGRYIVAEFDFKGDMNAVAEQLEQHIQSLRENGLTDSDRVPTQERYMRGCTLHAIENDEVEMHTEFKKAMRTGDVSTMMKITNRNERLRETMHEKKECLCYTNNLAL